MVLHGKIDPTLTELIEAAKDHPIRMTVPLPSDIEMEDTEAIRAYVDEMLSSQIVEIFDDGLVENRYEQK